MTGRKEFSFPSPPQVGTSLRNGKRWMTMVAVKPYVRKDGFPSFILVWESDDGRTATTGLAGSGWTWVKS